MGKELKKRTEVETILRVMSGVPGEGYMLAKTKFLFSWTYHCSSLKIWPFLNFSRALAVGPYGFFLIARPTISFFSSKKGTE